MTSRFPFLPVVLASFAIIHASRAQTVEFANFQTGSFQFGAPGHFGGTSKSEAVPVGSLGSIQTGISTSGTAWGVQTISNPPTGVAIPSSWVDPLFPGNLSGLTVLAFLGGIGDTVTISLDFSGLVNGILPAGSVIAYNDIDGGEQAIFSAGISNWYSLTGGNFYQGGTNIGSPWTTGQPSPGPGDIPSAAGSTASSLVLSGTGANTDSVTNFIITLLDLTSLNITASGTPGQQFAQALAVGVVPEPSGAVLIGLTGAVLLLRRRV